MIFLASLWGAYKFGHGAGLTTGIREGRVKGYEAGIIEGVRVATMAINNPEELEREAKIKNIVDSEFSNHQ